MTKARDLATSGPSTGLVLLHTETVSASVASISVDNVFSATYSSYKIVTKLKSTSVGGDLTLRLRVSGTDNSGPNYLYQRSSGGGATPTADNTTETSFLIGATSTQTPFTQETIISYPFATAITNILSKGGRHNNTHQITGYHTQTTSYTGFTIIGAAGNVDSGIIQVFGIKE